MSAPGQSVLQQDAGERAARERSLQTAVALESHFSKACPDAIVECKARIILSVATRGVLTLSEVQASVSPRLRASAWL